MLEGETTACVDSQTVSLSAGDLLIVFPNQVHHYAETGQGRSVLLIFPPDLCPEYRTLFQHFQPESPLLMQAARSSRILPMLEGILQEKDLDAPCHDAVLRGHFLILLGEVFRLLQLRPARQTGSDTLQNMLAYCMRHHHEDIRLDDVARGVHMSRYHVSRLFNERLRMGFNEYVNRLRVSEACGLLLGDDAKLIAIAHATGFSSSRTFNRAFAAYVGMTPGEYRRRHAKRPDTGGG